MLRKILPVVLLLVGSGAGVGAGMFLRPEPAAKVEGHAADAEEETHDTEKDHAARDGDAGHGDKAHGADASEPEYVKLSNQFVVPIVEQREVVAMVVLALSLEVPQGAREAVFRREPKLRDSFLQVLFDHANIGGFDGPFTEANNLAVLRRALKEAGQRDMDAETIRDVLILEIARQDY